MKLNDYLFHIKLVIFFAFIILFALLRSVDAQRHDALTVQHGSSRILSRKPALLLKSYDSLQRFRRDDNSSDSADSEESDTESSDESELTTTESGLQIAKINEEIIQKDGDAKQQLNDQKEDYEKKKKIDKIIKKNKSDKDDDDNADDDDDDDDDEDDNDDDDDDDDAGDKDGTCDYSTSTILRNFNTSHFLPVDYHQNLEAFRALNYTTDVNHLNDTLVLLDRFTDYARRLGKDSDLSKSMRYIASIMSDYLYEAKLEPNCTSDLLQIIVSAKEFEFWALKFPDSWGNLLPSGIMTGLASSLGEYDQCTSIKSPPLKDNKLIYGRYCNAQIRIPVPDSKDYDPRWEAILLAHQKAKYRHPIIENYANFVVDNDVPIVKFVLQFMKLVRSRMVNYGICFPSSCTANELETILNSLIYPITKTHIIIDPELCTDHAEIRHSTLNNFQLFSISIISIFVFLTLGSTIYHVRLNDQEISKKNKVIISGNNHVQSDHNNNHQPNCKIHIKSDKVQIPEAKDIFLCFSLISNWSKLTEACREPRRSCFLDLARIYLTCQTFFVQSFFFNGLTFSSLRSLVSGFPTEYIEQTRYFPGHLPSLLFDGLMFVMCTNLMLSQFDRLSQKGVQFNYFVYLLKRWFRMSVVLLGAIMFLYLLPLTGDGPLWYQNERWLIHPCKDWSTLVSGFLYYSNWNPALNNYELSDHLPICHMSSWIMSVSTQIYIFLPLIFLPLYYRPKTGIIILATVIVLSPLATTFPTWALGHSTYMDLHDYSTSSPQEFYRRLMNYHMSPLQYITSSSMGLLVGYLIVRHPKIKIPGGRRMELSLYYVLVILMIGCVYWNDTFWQKETRISQWNILTWFVTAKFLFPITLGYFAYMTHTGRARQINRVFSSSFLQPLSKFTLCIYLVRIMLIWRRSTSIRHVYTFTFGDATQNVLNDFTISVFYGLIMHLMFEAPTLALIHYCERRSKQVANCDFKSESFRKIDSDHIETSVNLEEKPKTLT